ncbi:DUF1499 domain-containing protein [Desulfosediminicola sp.]|uniref:DUF1499 domain-containing protein n=1 Tax=Desulfosediminicola sp. TaxID=2886825 RepID=UPI003AF26DEF
MKKIITVVLATFLLLAGCTGSSPELGLENGYLKKCPDKPNCVNSQINDKEHFIKPILVTSTQIDTKKHILQILRESKRTEVKDVGNDYIRAEVSSAVFRFVDDVEFYFPETQSKEMLIHVRSASRLGYYDFGVNRKRVEDIRNKLSSYTSN